MRDIVLHTADLFASRKIENSLQPIFFEPIIAKQQNELLLHLRTWIRRRHESFALWPEKDQKKWIAFNLSLDAQQWKSLVNVIESGMTPQQIDLFHESGEDSEKQLRQSLVDFFQNHLEYLRA